MDLHAFVIKLEIMLIILLIALSVIDSIFVYVAIKYTKIDDQLISEKEQKDYWLKLHFKLGVTLTNFLKIILSIFILFFYLAISKSALAFELGSLIYAIVSVFLFHEIYFIIHVLRLKKRKNGVTH